MVAFYSSINFNYSYFSFKAYSYFFLITISQWVIYARILYSESSDFMISEHIFSNIPLVLLVQVWNYDFIF